MGESFGGSVDMTSEKEKATSTQDQLRIWDALLEVRIRMQRILLEVNKLPQTETFKRVVESPLSKDVKLPASSNKALSNVQEFVDNLLNLQEVMTLNNPETNGAINKKRKAKSGNDNDDEDEGIDDDEEITSEEDEGKEDDEKEEEMELNSEDDKSESDEDVQEKKKSTTVATKASTTPPKKKKRRLEEYHKQIDTEFKKFDSYRNDIIQKWNDKTQMAFGKFRSKGSAGPQIPTLKQISHILSDKERLIKRTQVKRTAYTTIGKPDANIQPSESAQDEEIFDDDDFYHQLLRELIDRKTTNVQDPVQLSRQWLELQKLRTKLKRVVDTDASKGRKIRYDVHPKLVNFMAPQDNCVMSEGAVKELMSSLFGKQPSN